MYSRCMEIWTLFPVHRRTRLDQDRFGLGEVADKDVARRMEQQQAGAAGGGEPIVVAVGILRQADVARTVSLQQPAWQVRWARVVAAPIGSVGEVADHCTETGCARAAGGNGWIYDSGTPCHQCKGPGTGIAQRSFRREELNDWRRRFPEADAILRDLHSQGLGSREVEEPGGIARRTYEDGQPPGDRAARLAVDHHARGWPDGRGRGRRARGW